MAQFDRNGPIPDHSFRIFEEKSDNGNIRYVVKNSYSRKKSFDTKQKAEIYLTELQLNGRFKIWGDL